MRMWLVGVQNHQVTMLSSEFFPSEFPHSLQNLVRRSSGRHRKDHIVDEPWRLPVRSYRSRGLPLMRLQVEVPVAHETVFESLEPEFFSGIRLNAQLPIASQVAEVLLHSC